MNTGAAHTPETLFIFFDIFGRVSAVVEVTPNRRVFAPIGERVGLSVWGLLCHAVFRYARVRAWSL